MAWVRYSHAQVDSRNPRALGCCDRCGFTYNHYKLQWQFQWQGPKLQNQRILVCPTCLDFPQEGLRTIIIPPDPIPISNPRPDGHNLELYSSSPPGYSVSGAPNALATEDGNWLTTESGLTLTTEINVVPTPTSSGYTVGTAGFGST